MLIFKCIFYYCNLYEFYVFSEPICHRTGLVRVSCVSYISYGKISRTMINSKHLFAGKSVVLCLQTLFDEQLWTDVSFTFPEEDDVEDINAHRLILASRSPVFQAMFYGPLADTSNKIEIKSISKQAFEDVLR